MSRGLLTLAFTIAMSVTLPPTADGQIMAEETTAFPIRDFLLQLQAGVNYEFRTTTLSGTSDTVLSLRPGTGSGPAPSLAGADGCAPVGGGTFSWAPSCFSYNSPTTQYVRLYLYAYYDAFRGTATVQYRTLPSGAWTTIAASASFGGHRGALNLPTATGRTLIETVFRPGNVSAHTLLLASPTALGSTRFATSSTGRNAFGTAQMDVDLAANGLAPGDWWVYFGGRYVGETGNTRLVRNDYFVSGNDLDGDGLSFALEASVGSCDRPSQSVGSFSCRNVGSRTHPECNVTGDNIAGDPECLDSLRDTDHDGLRDDLEVYGLGGTLNLPRYGADPGRMDVFVELDASDQDLSTPNCQGFNLIPNAPGYLPAVGDEDPTAGLPARDFIGGLTTVWANGPTWMNPSGASGIAVHYDVGLAAPDPRETRYGAWGGGNTCVPSSCGGTGAYTSGACPGVPAAVSDARKWLFSWGIDWPSGAGTADVLGGTYWAASIGGHAHELGHVEGLPHEGPFGTAEATTTCTGYGQTWATTNYRAHFLSRMNYRYTYVGGQGESPAIFDGFSFSSGTLLTSLPSGGLSSAAAPEVCPFPGRSTSDLYYLSTAENGTEDDIHVAAGSGGCANVNWDADLVGSPPVLENFEAGTTHVRVRESLRGERRRFLEPFLSPSDGTYSVGPSAAAIVNGVLLFAYRTCNASGVCAGRLRGDSNGDCLIYPVNPESPSYVPADGAYPSCFRTGSAVAAGSTSLDPESVGIVGYRSDGGAGTPDRVAEVLMSGTGGIYYALFNPQPGGSAEFTGGPTTFVSTGLTGTVGTTFRDLSAARVPGTNDILVTYTVAGGSMRQFALDPDAGTVTSYANASSGGSPLAPGISAASMAVVDGRVFMVRNIDASTMELWRLADTGSPVHTREWELMRNLPALTGSTPSIIRSVEYDTVNTSRVYVLAQRPSGAYWLHRAPATSTWYSNSATWETTRVYATDEGVVAGTASGVYDDRVGIPAGTRGLRILRTREWNGGTGVEHDPFADGADPSVGLDHNEWDGLQWGVCRVRQALDTFAYSVALSTYVPVPYADFDRCGDLPNFSIPTASGPVLMTRGNGHRTTNPTLYPGGQACTTGH